MQVEQTTYVASSSTSAGPRGFRTTRSPGERLHRICRCRFFGMRYPFTCLDSESYLCYKPLPKPAEIMRNLILGSAYKF